MIKYEFSKYALRYLLMGYMVAMFDNIIKHSTMEIMISNVLHENRHLLHGLQYMNILTDERFVSIFLGYKKSTKYVISIGEILHEDGRIEPYIKFQSYRPLFVCKGKKE